MEYFSADSPCLKHKSPFCKRFPRQRDPFNLEKLPFEDVLNRQKHFYPTSPLPPELLALGRICKNAKSNVERFAKHARIRDGCPMRVAWSFKDVLQISS